MVASRVIGDVSKIEVYALAKYHNKKTGRAIIPENCFNKIPSAELRPGQFDPFDCSEVSALVDEVIENRLSREELVQKGYDRTWLTIHSDVSRTPNTSGAKLLQQSRSRSRPSVWVGRC